MKPHETDNPAQDQIQSFAAGLFQGKRVLITGASRGIGRACALSFGRLGAHLCLISRRSEGLNLLKAELKALKDPSSHLLMADEVIVEEAIDIAQAQEFKDCLERIKDKLGGIDILVNNAGLYLTEEVRGHSLTAWQITLDTNLTSAMVASSCLLEGMIAQKWGRVINISSISGKAGEAYGSAYSASKFGLLGLTQSMALEVARYGVTVNAVCPGWVATDMALDQIKDPRWCKLNDIEPTDSLDIARLSVPQERMIEPTEVAALVTYLATDDARGITGQAINICGGLSIH